MAVSEVGVGKLCCSTTAESYYTLNDTNENPQQYGRFQHARWQLCMCV
jgi:hypothetical protein